MTGPVVVMYPIDLYLSLSCLVSLLFSYFRSVLSHLNITYNLFTPVCSHLGHCFVIFFFDVLMLSLSAPGPHDCVGHSWGSAPTSLLQGTLVVSHVVYLYLHLGQSKRCCLVMPDASFVGMLDHNSCFYKVKNWITCIKIFSY